MLAWLACILMAWYLLALAALQTMMSQGSTNCQMDQAHFFEKINKVVWLYFQGCFEREKYLE